ncbi:MAG: 2-hydroxyacid dehydrogenase [Oscillospiraceae bacterium]|nr:2-hydroxyacid dehydrogenase [Oscillospiraceae bacterium]
MEKIAFYDTKPYDKVWFDKLNTDYEIKYIESKLTPDTAHAARGCKAVVAFVNDNIGSETVDELCEIGVKLIALRCAGYNNVDLKYAKDKINIVRVPVYSPYAIAEHTMALLLSVNRKIPRAFIRTRDFNFSLNGLTGFDLHGKTAGVIGTGQIGRIFIDICKGFGMKVIAYDPYPAEGYNIEYVSFDKLLAESDVISLHCPLTTETRYIINEASITKMKDGAVILNTSRGQLIDTDALLQALKDKKIRGAGLDVYEEETELFFEDYSSTIIQDDVLSLLVSLPNVIMTSHQAFLTDEALQKIAEVTLFNLKQFFDGEALQNSVVYQK